MSDKKIRPAFFSYHSSLITYHQPVMPPLDARGQQLGVAGVFDVVCDVREVGAARAQLFDVGERALQPEVRRVRGEAQAVEHEHVQVAQQFERAGRYLAQVGRVGEVVEAVGDDGQPPVDDLDGRHFKAGAEAE